MGGSPFLLTRPLLFPALTATLSPMFHSASLLFALTEVGAVATGLSVAAAVVALWSLVEVGRSTFVNAGRLRRLRTPVAGHRWLRVHVTHSLVRVRPLFSRIDLLSLPFQAVANACVRYRPSPRLSSLAGSEPSSDDSSADDSSRDSSSGTGHPSDHVLWVAALPLPTTDGDTLAPEVWASLLSSPTRRIFPPSRFGLDAAFQRCASISNAADKIILDKTTAAKTTAARTTVLTPRFEPREQVWYSLKLGDTPVVAHCCASVSGGFEVEAHRLEDGVVCAYLSSSRLLDATLILDGVHYATAPLPPPPSAASLGEVPAPSWAPLGALLLPTAVWSLESPPVSPLTQLNNPPGIAVSLRTAAHGEVVAYCPPHDVSHLRLFSSASAEAVDEIEGFSELVLDLSAREAGAAYAVLPLPTRDAELAPSEWAVLAEGLDVQGYWLQSVESWQLPSPDTLHVIHAALAVLAFHLTSTRLRLLQDGTILWDPAIDDEPSPLEEVELARSLLHAVGLSEEFAVLLRRMSEDLPEWRLISISSYLSDGLSDISLRVASDLGVWRKLLADAAVVLAD